MSSCRVIYIERECYIYIPSLPEDAILCTIEVVGLYPNIQHGGGLAAIKEALEKRDDNLFLLKL